MHLSTTPRMTESRTIRRIHIGNISPQLAANSASLAARLLKFGEVSNPLEFHTKPVNDFFYAYVDMNLTSKEYEKLRSAFNGITYMGRKLSIAPAKPTFVKAGEKDRHRPDTSPRLLAKQEGIAHARNLRLLESRTGRVLNSVTFAPLSRTSIIGASNSALGYRKCPHTTNNVCGNTKNDASFLSLIGSKSYGSTLTGKGPFSQQYSRISGYGEVIKGRFRRTARPTAHFARKEQSLRVLVNGELKNYKFHKTKLWGVEKNKTTRDLTFEFANGVWRSGFGHEVERLDIKKHFPSLPDSCAISAKDAEEYGSAVQERDPTPADDRKDDAEQSRNKKVLSKLFNTFDFNKKVVLEEVQNEESDAFGSKGKKTIETFDFEVQGTILCNESDDDIDCSSGAALLESYQKSHERPAGLTYYSEGDEGNEMDSDHLALRYATEAIKVQSYEKHNMETAVKKNGKANEEFFEQPNPTEECSSRLESSESCHSSGSERETVTEKYSQEDSNPEIQEESEEEIIISSYGPSATSTTESLRSLFNNDKTKTAFNLDLDEDDVDREKIKEEEVERKKLQEKFEAKKQEYQSSIQNQLRAKDVGLFWLHSDSPYLQQQTQLSKIGHIQQSVVLPGEAADQIMMTENNADEDNYEKWFWSMRGEISRECKKRKREVTRRMKKKRTFV